MDNFMLFFENEEREQLRRQQQQQQQQLQQQLQEQQQLYQQQQQQQQQQLQLLQQQQQQQHRKLPPASNNRKRQRSSTQSSPSSKSYATAAATATADASHPRRYFAIRHCHSLHAPAIFCSWEDCSVYVDSDEDMNTNDEVIEDPEFQVFDHLQKAVEYIDFYLFEIQQELKEKQEKQQSLDTNFATTANQYNIRKQSAESMLLLENNRIRTAPPPPTQVQVRGDFNHRPANRKKLPLAATATATRTPTKVSPSIRNSTAANNKSRNRSVSTTLPQRTSTAAMETDEESDFHRMLQVFKDTMAARKPIKENPELRAWIDEQREGYNAMRNKSPNTTMTVERLTSLTKAGFPFEKRQTLPWDVRAKQWLEYYTEHGKDPGQDFDRGLCKWVYNQKAKYAERREGKDNNLTDEQINQLTEWGFCWEFKYRAPKEGLSSWEDRFQDLVEFKKVHGHTKPPASLPGLGRWIERQRYNYRKFMRGEKSAIDGAKVEKLLSIGFQFVTDWEKKQQLQKQLKLLGYTPPPKPKKKPGRPPRKVKAEEEKEEETDP